MYDGMINVCKEKGFTSHDVVAKLRGILHQKKIGHTGTLDPDATGVLPVCLGKGTKLCDMITDRDKTYRAVMMLGRTTDTQDISGQILTEKAVNVDEREVRDAAVSFVGDYMQIPPMYSAVKINGKRLYDLARQGVEVERAARPVTVYSIELSDYDEEKRTGTLDIYCSKGTYIRTIISDIGKKLGTGAIMTSLCRTMAAGFTLSDCHDIETLRNMPPEDTARLVLPTERVFSCYDEITLDGTQKKLFMNGMILDCGRMDISYPEGTCLRLKHDGDFLGVARVNGENGLKSVYLNILS